jgi:SAM-dependent methyltransferase
MPSVRPRLQPKEQEMPSRSIVKAAVRTARSLPRWPDLRVLDLSCGDGRVLELLARDGAQAEGTHFRQDDYIFKSPSAVLSQIPLHRGVDLTRPLAFPDGQFDLVLATEVMEHLPTCIPLLAEIARILKPRGHFLFSTPNIHCLQSRLRFLLTGQHELYGGRLGWQVPAGDLYSTHHNPVYFPVLHTLLHHNQLDIQRLVFTECPWSAALLAPLYPLVAAASALEACHAIRRSPAGGRDLLRWLLHPRLLFSNQLMVLARKS